MNRRSFLNRSLGATLGLSASGLLLRGLAQEGNPAAGMINQNTQSAITGSLRWLAGQQHPDGSFGTGQYHGNVAVTSVCGLAFMAGGYQPGRGQYGDNVTRAIRHILRSEEGNSGFLTNRGGVFSGPMYGHGFATLFLAEVYGMVNEPGLRDQLRGTLGRAINLTLTAQNRTREGGWRYTPNSTDSDLSVTVCQIMALRAARNAGIAVPASNARRCTDYVKNCQDPNTGGFRYQANFGGGAGFARTAAGVVALNSAGIYFDPMAQGDEARRRDGSA